MVSLDILNKGLGINVVYDNVMHIIPNPKNSILDLSETIEFVIVMENGELSHVQRG